MRESGVMGLGMRQKEGTEVYFVEAVYMRAVCGGEICVEGMVSVREMRCSCIGHIFTPQSSKIRLLCLKVRQQVCVFKKCPEHENITKYTNVYCDRLCNVLVQCMSPESMVCCFMRTPSAC